MPRAKWQPDTVGSWNWEEEPKQQFLPENGIDISQLDPSYSGRDWMWGCDQGHRWKASAKKWNDHSERWRRITPRWSCPECIARSLGPIRECGHSDPGAAVSFLLGKVRVDGTRETMAGNCKDCSEPWRCGGESVNSNPDEDCYRCRSDTATLASHPERAELIRQLGLKPHSGQGHEMQCEHDSHPTEVLYYEHAVRGTTNPCKICWKMRQSDGYRTPVGETFTVRRELPSSGAEMKVRKFLSDNFEVIEHNAVSIEGDLFGRGEVTPDILIEGQIAVEVDSPGRDGEWHTGSRQEADEVKDSAIRKAGWKVVRIRMNGLPPLGTADANILCAHGVTRQALAEAKNVLLNLGARQSRSDEPGK